MPRRRGATLQSSGSLNQNRVGVINKYGGVYTYRYGGVHNDRVWDVRHASKFWDTVATKELSKDEIALSARYFVQSYRLQGYTRVADKFLREAKIEEDEELEGDLGAYTAKWCQENTDNNCEMAWMHLCHDMLKLRRHNETTTINQQQPDDDYISQQRRDAFWNITRYIILYFGENVDYLDKTEMDQIYEAKRRYYAQHSCGSFGSKSTGSKEQCKSSQEK